MPAREMEREGCSLSSGDVIFPCVEEFGMEVVFFKGDWNGMQLSQDGGVFAGFVRS